MITAYIHSLFWQRLSGSRQKHPHARLPHTGAERRMPRVAVSCVAGAGPFWMWCALCLYCSIFRRFFQGKFGGLCSGAARYLLKRGETRRGKIPSWLLTGKFIHDRIRTRCRHIRLQAVGPPFFRNGGDAYGYICGTVPVLSGDPGRCYCRPRSNKKEITATPRK